MGDPEDPQVTMAFKTETVYFWMIWGSLHDALEDS